jgi:hypothetical protein
MLVQSEQASSAFGNALDETRNDETKTKLKTNIFIFFFVASKKDFTLQNFKWTKSRNWNSFKDKKVIGQEINLKQINW